MVEYNRHKISLFTTSLFVLGRGPCQNYGAKRARGPLLVFLHADTELPYEWDGKVRRALKEEGVTAAAFNFGIRSEENMPRGIKAVESTANWRTRLYNLPYGDQCLSIRRDVFKFIGGFPANCLMEDYDLVGLLRLRAAVLNENIKIIPGDPARCDASYPGGP